ncbi:hypothetical protein J1614_000795 [Plenodomus biglobosus]|nr:hypothetical protein J1614_000795 [Plenodomus biglobosus]
MTSILDAPGASSPNRFSQLMQNVCASTDSSSTIEEAANSIVTAVRMSKAPGNTLWQVWDAFFKAVVDSSSNHIQLLALLDALRKQRSLSFSPGSTAARSLRSHTEADGKLHWAMLPGFGTQWYDTNSILEEWRDWDGVRVPTGDKLSVTSTLSSSATDFYLRFIEFSTAALNVAGMEHQIHPINVFYACKNVLECKSVKPSDTRPHRLSSEQKRALDIRVAATWVREGGRHLAAMEPAELRQHWAAALDEQTEFWPRKDGLTWERWKLWMERLIALRAGEEVLDEETRGITAQAVDVIRDIVSLSQA